MIPLYLLKNMNRNNYYHCLDCNIKLCVNCNNLIDSFNNLLLT